MDNGKDTHMILKIVGAAFVVLGCGGVGFRIAASHRQQENELRKLINALDYMECELQYHLTPLPLLCRQTSKETAGKISNVFLDFSIEMESQNSNSTTLCMGTAIEKNPGLSAKTVKLLSELGASVGRFDIEGQLKGLESIRQECRQTLSGLESNRDERLRSYQTLGLCARKKHQ